MQPPSIAEVRGRLVNARIGLRDAADALAAVKARAEQRIVEAAGGAKALGANAEERERAIALALQKDEEYQQVWGSQRSLDALVIRLEAELEDGLDERREREWAVRLRMADALEHIATAKLHNNDHAEDDSLDAVAVYQAERVAQGAITTGPDALDRAIAEADDEDLAGLPF